MEQRDSGFKASNPKEDPIQNLRSLINQLGQEVTILLDSERSGIATNENLRADYCRRINGEVLVRLINNYQIPGMIMTLQPLEKQFTNPSWWFHSVGIIQVDEDSYVSFDQSTKDQQGKYHFHSGSLSDITEQLNNAFGFDWNLTFVPKNNPENSVVAKIKTAATMIENAEKASYDDVSPAEPLIAENKAIHKKLGLKYIPISRIAWTNKEMRERFTFGYA